MKSGFSHKIKSKFSALIAGGILLAVLALGLAATAFLLQSNQDLRQRASEGLYGSVAQDTGKSDGVCLGVGEKCASGTSHFDGSCPVTETRCGSQSAVVTTVQVATTDKCTQQQHLNCTFGCDSETGQCKQGKANNELCSNNGECNSLNCVATPGGKYCMAAGTTLSTPVTEGGVCGTTAYNRECQTGLICQANRCVKPTSVQTISIGSCLVDGANCSGNQGYADTSCASGVRCGVRATNQIVSNAAEEMNTKKLTGSCSTLACPSGFQRQVETTGICSCVIPKLTNGSRCNNDNDCSSHNCEAGPGGKYCTAGNSPLSPKIPEGRVCGTTPYNRECSEGLVCSQNACVKATGEITIIPSGKCFESGGRCEVAGHSDTTCDTGIRCGKMPSPAPLPLDICTDAKTIQECGEAGSACAWYSCSNRCVTWGTSFAGAGCMESCDTLLCAHNEEKVSQKSKGINNNLCTCEFKKSPDGMSCTQNNACQSGNCQKTTYGSVCAPKGEIYPKLAGDSCNNSNPCMAGLTCSEGICKSFCQADPHSACSSEGVGMCQISAITHAVGDYADRSYPQVSSRYLICKDGSWQSYGNEQSKQTNITFTHCSPERIESLTQALFSIENIVSITNKQISISCQERPGIPNPQFPSNNCTGGEYWKSGPNFQQEIIGMYCHQCFTNERDISQCEEETMAHEMMHMYANTINEYNGSEINSYNQAVGCFSVGKGEYVFTHEEPVRSYGRTNCAEALATAVEAFTSDPCRLKRNFPIQFEWFVSHEDSPYKGVEIDCSARG